MSNPNRSSRQSRQVVREKVPTDRKEGQRGTRMRSQERKGKDKEWFNVRDVVENNQRVEEKHKIRKVRRRPGSRERSLERRQVGVVVTKGPGLEEGMAELVLYNTDGKDADLDPKKVPKGSTLHHEAYKKAYNRDLKKGDRVVATGFSNNPNNHRSGTFNMGNRGYVDKDFYWGHNDDTREASDEEREFVTDVQNKLQNGKSEYVWD